MNFCGRIFFISDVLGIMDWIKKFDRESSSEVCKMWGCLKCKYENCIFIFWRLTCTGSTDNGCRFIHLCLKRLPSSIFHFLLVYKTQPYKFKLTPLTVSPLENLSLISLFMLLNFPGWFAPHEILCWRSIFDTSYSPSNLSWQWMNEWMDGWIDGWMDGWMNWWMNGWMDGWIDGWMDGQSINRWIDRWIYDEALADLWMDGLMNDMPSHALPRHAFIISIWSVVVNRGYDTCFWKRLVMGYADY